MNNLGLSRSAKALLDAAKSDGPSTAARAKIWGGVASGAGAVGAVGAASVVGTSAIAAGSVSAAPPALTAGSALTSGALAGSGAAGGMHTAAAAATGGKLLAMGALFGSALTVGIAATLLGIGRTPSLLPDPQYAESAPMVQPAYTNGGGVHPSGAVVNAVGNSSGRLNNPEPGNPQTGNPPETGNPETGNRGSAASPNGAVAANDAVAANGANGANGARAAGDFAGSNAASGAASPSTGGQASGASSPSAPGGSAIGSSSLSAVRPGEAHRGDAHREGGVRAVREDTLMRESALVGEARGALMRGDSKAALAAINATKTLKHRELEPEELSLEAKALRAMGREGDAASLEIVLKSRYPDHALAR